MAGVGELVGTDIATFIATVAAIIGYLKKQEIDRETRVQAIREENAAKMQQAICKFTPLPDSDKDQYKCAFREEDHSKISDSLMIHKTNEIVLKEVVNDQDKIVASMERVIDKFEDIARELRQEQSNLRTLLGKGSTKRGNN